MDIRLEAKDAPFIRTLGAKKPSENSTISPLFWGEMGRGYGKIRKEGANVRFSPPM
jgi:hypothetical protein